MRKRDRKALGAYIRWVADHIELRDWDFTLLGEPCADEQNGHISITYGRKLAQISVHSDFRSWPGARQRHVITHELIHCHLEPACNMVQSDLEDWLGKAADDIFFAGFKRQIEYAVDALASALSPHMPLIDWPE